MTFDYWFPWEFYRMLNPQAKTKRGIQNTYYMQQASAKLLRLYHGNPKYREWIEYFINPKTGQFLKKTVLAELGRFIVCSENAELEGRCSPRHEEVFILLCENIANSKIKTNSAQPTLKHRRRRL